MTSQFGTQVRSGCLSRHFKWHSEFCDLLERIAGAAWIEPQLLKDRESGEWCDWLIDGARKLESFSRRKCGRNLGRRAGIVSKKTEPGQRERRHKDILHPTDCFRRVNFQRPLSSKRRLEKSIKVRHALVRLFSWRQQRLNLKRNCGRKDMGSMR